MGWGKKRYNNKGDVYGMWFPWKSSPHTGILDISTPICKVCANVVECVRYIKSARQGYDPFLPVIQGTSAAGPTKAAILGAAHLTPKQILTGTQSNIWYSRFACRQTELYTESLRSWLEDLGVTGQLAFYRRGNWGPERGVEMTCQWQDQGPEAVLFLLHSL